MSNMDVPGAAKAHATHTFWKKVSAIAGLIGAIAALITAAHQIGWIGGGDSGNGDTAGAEGGSGASGSSGSSGTSGDGGVDNAANTANTSRRQDRSNPEYVARKVLEALQARDDATLSGLTVPWQRVTDADVEDLLDSWVGSEVRSWNGHLGDVRYRRITGTKDDYVRARVLYAHGKGEVAVVELRLQGDQWYFADLQSPSPSSFEADSLTRP